jgi:hypothetical protein
MTDPSPSPYPGRFDKCVPSECIACILSSSLKFQLESLIFDFFFTTSVDLEIFAFILNLDYTFANLFPIPIINDTDAKFGRWTILIKGFCRGRM